MERERGRRKVLICPSGRTFWETRLDARGSDHVIPHIRKAALIANPS